MLHQVLVYCNQEMKFPNKHWCLEHLERRVACHSSLCQHAPPAFWLWLEQVAWAITQVWEHENVRCHRPGDMPVLKSWYMAGHHCVHKKATCHTKMWQHGSQIRWIISFPLCSHKHVVETINLELYQVQKFRVSEDWQVNIYIYFWVDWHIELFLNHAFLWLENTFLRQQKSFS